MDVIKSYMPGASDEIAQRIVKDVIREIEPILYIAIRNKMMQECK